MAIPVYCMPGMAASSRIFQHLEWPEEYEVHLLDWDEPRAKESFAAYASRIAQRITAPNPILIGVSLGGVLVQQIATLLPAYRGVVLISSIKSAEELPRWMRCCKRLRLQNLLPLEWLASFEFWKRTKRYRKLYYKYIGLASAHYLAWCARELLNWQFPTLPPEKLIHIQGDKDIVFPIKNIKDCIRIHNGTHIMIISRFRWFREHFVTLIERFSNQ